MKIKKYFSKIFLTILLIEIQGKLIGHVGKVVFSPILRLSQPNIDAASNDIDTKPQNGLVFEDHGSRRCYKKVVMVEERVEASVDPKVEEIVDLSVLPTTSKTLTLFKASLTIPSQLSSS